MHNQVYESAFSAGFLGFHLAAAHFEGRPSRIAQITRQLNRLYSLLGISADQFQTFLRHKEITQPELDHHVREMVSKQVSQQFDTKAGQLVEFGYLFGLTLAALVGQLDADLSQTSTQEELICIEKGVPALLRLANSADLPSEISELLKQAQLSLQQYKNQDSLRRCHSYLLAVYGACIGRIG